jgi:hypothetical protein
MTNLKLVLPLFLTSMLLTGCGGGDSGTETGSNIVFNEVRTVPEGNYVTIALPTSNYRAEISSSNNGVKVEWVGGTNCVNSGEVKTYMNTCAMVQKGQIVITNPTMLGLGGDEVVTIKIIKI